MWGTVPIYVRVLRATTEVRSRQQGVDDRGSLYITKHTKQMSSQENASYLSNVIVEEVYNFSTSE